LVFIDFEQKKYGVVNFNGESITWGNIDELYEIDKDNKYNNISYLKENGLLDLKSYHLIGENARFDIKLNNFVQEVKEVEQVEKRTSTDETDDKGVEVEVSVETLPTPNDKDNVNVLSRLTTQSQEYAAEKLEITQKDFYENILLMLR